MTNKQEYMSGVACLTGILGTFGLASLFNLAAVPLIGVTTLTIGTAACFGVFLYSVATIAKLDSERNRLIAGGHHRDGIPKSEPKVP